MSKIFEQSPSGLNEAWLQFHQWLEVETRIENKALYFSFQEVFSKNENDKWVSKVFFSTEPHVIGNTTLEFPMLEVNLKQLYDNFVEERARIELSIESKVYEPTLEGFRDAADAYNSFLKKYEKEIHDHGFNFQTAFTYGHTKEGSEKQWKNVDIILMRNGEQITLGSSPNLPFTHKELEKLFVTHEREYIKNTARFIELCSELDIHI